MSRYIALEGVDGSGKSTVATALAERLEALGTKVIVVREPGGTTLGEVVRGLLLDSQSLDVWAEVFLFAAQRAELAAELVKPALDAGTWVISDRTYYSSMAYQGNARGLGVDRVREINELGLRGVVPDLVFVLDVDPKEALSRQNRPDRIGRESAVFQSRVREGYLALAAADPERVIVIDGSMSVGEMVDSIMERAS
ncbi:MAG: dTMP kinase [Acidimicrobiia bacterium]